MVKLIVSDIDGTLLPYGQINLRPSLFQVIEQLRERGVIFCPASGRQYHSLRGLFAPVQDELAYLCENGAILYGAGREEDVPVLGKTSMPREASLALAEDILALPGCQLLVSGANVSYVCRCTSDYVSMLKDEKGNRVQILEHPRQIEEDILKVSAYCPAGTKEPAQVLGPQWGEALHMAAAGPDWLDFTLADKGTGLEQLCRALGVSPEETVAFGDNWNDAAMLHRAGRGYLMEQADPELGKQFSLRCSDVEERLRDFLAGGTL